MQLRPQRLALAATVATVGVLLAGCTPTTSTGSDQLLVVGTTDSPVSLDPAGSFDRGSANIANQIYQHLLTIEPGTTTPTPDAAEACDFSSATTYVCEVKPGLTFSNGDDLTASDVAYSFTRVKDIADANGPSSLFEPLVSAEATGDLEVTFTLSIENYASWPLILTTIAGAIVDEEVYPDDALLTGTKTVGSGPYVATTDSDYSLVKFVANDQYQGTNTPVTEEIALRNYASSNNLKLALQQGEVDLVWGGLGVTDLADLRTDDTVNVVDGPGGELRYIVFNVDTQPGDSDAQKLAIRQAVAYSIDREALSEKVYQGSYQPAYTLVTDGLLGATPAFEDRYGSTPDIDAARQTLEAAGVSLPVALPLEYNTDHYGSSSSEEYAAIKDQLESTGLFTVDLQSAEWSSYVESFRNNGYPLFQLGWFPDFPDPDNYLGGMLGTVNNLSNNYSNPRADELLLAEKSAADESTRLAALTELQEIAAADAPVIPLLQGQQAVPARANVTGVEEPVDAALTLRLWVLGKQ